MTTFTWALSTQTFISITNVKSEHRTALPRHQGIMLPGHQIVLMTEESLEIPHPALLEARITYQKWTPAAVSLVPNVGRWGTLKETDSGFIDITAQDICQQMPIPHINLFLWVLRRVKFSKWIVVGNLVPHYQLAWWVGGWYFCSMGSENGCAVGLTNYGQIDPVSVHANLLRIWQFADFRPPWCVKKYNDFYMSDIDEAVLVLERAKEWILFTS